MTRRISGLLLGAVLALGLTGPAAAQEVRVPQSQAEIKLSFAPVVKRTAPAVVNIYTRKVVQARRLSPLMQDPFFRRFFGDALRGFGGVERRVQNSLGSGVIVGSEGIVVTNDHVVRNADQITVVLQDRREFEAELIGTDERTDLAVLRLAGVEDDLPTLQLADSDSLEVGDLVLAIGNPFGVGQTVTSGIVSALARTNIGVSDFRSFIQTDAAINPGNSGGALVTLDGRLVGINTAIYSKDGGNVGIGFAIPANMVKTVVAGIVETGKAVRPWLGAEGQPVEPEIAASIGLDRPRGVLINRIVPGSPAAKAGLRVGDVVVAVNGKDVVDVQGLRYRIATLPVGGRATLTVLRDGAAAEVSIALRAAPDTPPRNVTVIDSRTPLNGTRVANLNPALAEELGRPYEAGSVIVLEVSRSGYAARLGIKPGDIIREVNRIEVTSVRELTRLLDRGARGGWLITVQRGARVLNFRVG